MEEPMGDALAILNREGSHRPSHRGAVFLGYFLWGEHQKATRRLKAKPKTKKNYDINYWILAFASMTRMRGWIPICTGMTNEEYGCLVLTGFPSARE